MCKPCAAGTYEEGTGKEICSKSCPTGTSTNGLVGQSSVNSCVSCETGKYASGVGRGVCTDCPPGSYADHVGQGSCTLCNVGHYEPNKGAKTCLKICAAGTSTNDMLGQATCTGCVEGKYASSTGQAHCESCPKGYHQNQQAMTSCVACKIGFSSEDKTGAIDCVACPSGKYANFVGTPKCYEQERAVPDEKDITATISVMAAMAVLVTLLGFTYYHRDTIFGSSETEMDEVSQQKDVSLANRA